MLPPFVLRHLQAVREGEHEVSDVGSSGAPENGGWENGSGAENGSAPVTRPHDPHHLHVPVRLDGTVVGEIVAWTGVERRIDATDASVLRVLASQTAAALQNSALHQRTLRLYDEASRHAEDLAARNEQLQRTRDALTVARQREVLDSERHRIARELHDSVTQYALSAGHADRGRALGDPRRGPARAPRDREAAHPARRRAAALRDLRAQPLRRARPPHAARDDRGALDGAHALRPAGRGAHRGPPGVAARHRGALAVPRGRRGAVQRRRARRGHGRRRPPRVPQGPPRALRRRRRHRRPRAGPALAARRRRPGPRRLPPGPREHGRAGAGDRRHAGGPACPPGRHPHPGRWSRSRSAPTPTRPPARHRPGRPGRREPSEPGGPPAVLDGETGQRTVGTAHDPSGTAARRPAVHDLGSTT